MANIVFLKMDPILNRARKTSVPGTKGQTFSDLHPLKTPTITSGCSDERDTEDWPSYAPLKTNMAPNLGTV